jgi:hypothetical protein
VLPVLLAGEADAGEVHGVARYDVDDAVVLLLSHTANLMDIDTADSRW